MKHTFSVRFEWEWRYSCVERFDKARPLPYRQQYLHPLSNERVRFHAMLFHIPNFYFKIVIIIWSTVLFDSYFDFILIFVRSNGKYWIQPYLLFKWKNGRKKRNCRKTRTKMDVSSSIHLPMMMYHILCLIFSDQLYSLLCTHIIPIHIFFSFYSVFFFPFPLLILFHAVYYYIYSMAYKKNPSSNYLFLFSYCIA